MNWNIKTKMVVMGAGVMLALGALAGINLVSMNVVDGTLETNTERIEAFQSMTDMRYAQVELVLAAMDSIVDKDAGKIRPERMQKIQKNIAFLKEHTRTFEAVASSDEEAETAKKIIVNIGLLAKGIGSDLPELIRSAGGRAAEIDARFAKIDDSLDGAADSLEERIGALEGMIRARRDDAGDAASALRISRILDRVQAMHLAVTQLILAAMDSIVDKDEGAVSPERMDIIRVSATTLRDSSTELASFVADDRERELLEHIRTDAEKLITSIETDLVQFIGTIAAEQIKTEAAFADIDDVLDQYADATAELMAGMAQRLTQDLDKATNELNRTVAMSGKVGAGIFLVVLVLVCGGVILFARSLLIPIGKTVRFADSVAAGDLDRELTVDSGDEIGRLADALRVMVDSLKKMIATADSKTEEAERQAQKARKAVAEAETAKTEAESAKRRGMHEAAERLDEIVNSMTAASDEIHNLVGQVRKGADAQNKRASETATAMEEMNATVLEVASSASTAAERSDAAMDVARKGADVVQRVVGAIGEVQKQSVEMKNSLSELGTRAKGIGQVINVINDIADQTNLLALNAAIEAARAGEAGRGFAVVADEVRKLAEKTVNATKEVDDAVSNIQEGTMRTITEMDVAGRAIDQSTMLSGEAGEALDEIVEIVTSSTDQVRSIATASEEQSATSEQINRSVEDVSRISAETARGMDHAGAAIEELTSLARRLQELIGEMRSE